MDPCSFLNTMFLRYVFRKELAIGMQNQLRLSRGNKNINFKMSCTPDQVSQIFNHADVKRCIRKAAYEFWADFSFAFNEFVTLLRYAFDGRIASLESNHTVAKLWEIEFFIDQLLSALSLI